VPLWQGNPEVLDDMRQEHRSGRHSSTDRVRMAEWNGDGWVYLALGVLLPLASVGVTIAWLKRRVC